MSDMPTDIQWIKKSLIGIENKLAEWPKECEGHRGHMHDRINRLYLWILGTIVAGQGIIGAMIYFTNKGGN